MATQPNLPATRPPKGGLPMWTYLAALLVVAVLGLGGLGYALYHSNSERNRIADALAAQQNEIDRRKLETQKADEQGKLTNARNQQEQLLAQVSAATNSLLQLLGGSDQVRTEAAALGSNEAGRTVALHPELVRLAGRVFESGLPEIPPEPDITTRLEAVRRIARQVRENSGKAYVPPQELAGTVQTHAAWGALLQTKVEQIHQVLNSLVRESQVKFTRATLTADSPTLAAAIAKRNEEVAGSQIKVAEATLSVARTNAVLKRAEAGAEATKTQAEAEAAAVTTRAQAEAEEIIATALRAAEESRRKQAEADAAKERDWQEREAAIKLAETKNKVAVQDKVDEARKLELRKKASDAAVKTKLAPFTTPGYVGVARPTAAKKPLSFAQLLASGALTATVHGQEKLVQIATDAHDNVRPRLAVNRYFFRRHPEEIQLVQETQELLSELGPTLVELGQLEP